MEITLRFITLALILLLPVTLYAGSDIRDYYSEPGINPYESLSQHPNESISTFNGSLTISHTDIVVPGNGGLDIKITRIYNGPLTSTPINDPAGQGWTMHFGRIVVPGSITRADVFTKLCQVPPSDLLTSADNPSIEFADGAREILFRVPFSPGVARKFITKSRIKAECLPEGAMNKDGKGMIVTTTDGTRYTMNEFARFSTDGGTTFFNFFYTTRIEDTNGNWINIEYKYAAGQKVIDKITTNDNREVRYSYINEGTVQMVLSSIEVVLNGGVPNQIWKYQYSDYFYRKVLDKVIRPDGSEWNYGYDKSATITPVPLLKQIIYPWGGKINYTYKLHDFIPGLGILRKPVIATKKVTDEIIKNGRVTSVTGTWIFDYSQGLDLNGNGVVDAGEYDKTTVTTPTAVYTYEHIGIFTSAASKNLWATGLPVYVTVEDKQGNLLERTVSTWSYQTISNEEYTRGRGVGNDEATYAPILISKSVFRDNVNYITNYSNHNVYGKPETVVSTSNIANESKQIDYTYFIDADRNIVKQEDEAILGVGTIDRTFDVNGNLLSLSKFGVTTNYTYYPTGDIETETDARQSATIYSDYYRGNAQQLNYSENVTVYRTINDAGMLENEINGRGYTTSYSYDEMNRLSGISYPMNDSVSINYQRLIPSRPSYPMTRTLIRGKYKEKVTFDGFGRIIKTERKDTSTGESIVTRKEYDVLGRVVFESYPNSERGISTTYDPLNRMSRIDNGDNTFSRYTYGPGNSTTITDERGNTTELTYRSYGSPDEEKVLVRINKPDADILTSMSRNKLGQLISVWQGSSSGTQGYLRSYGYDSRYFLTTVTNPETGVTTYGRDALGNMQSKQVGSSGITTYTYDTLNRLQFIDYPGTTEDVTYTYDANSNVETITNATSTILYQYDANDNKYSEQVDINGQSYITSYLIDQLDNIDSVTYHSGRLVSYSPDAFGRATAASPYVNRVSYHPNSQISKMVYANGHITTTTLNQRQWVERVSATDGQTNVIDLNYGYDEKGNIEKIDDILEPAYSREMEYDHADRLEEVEGYWGETEFSYDQFGNIRKKKVNDIETIFNYNNNRLVQTTGTITNSMGYDDYGNIISNGRHNFIYDDAGNLLLSKQVTIPGTPSFNSTLYKYDGNNMRVVRSRNGSERHYLFAANGNQLGEYDPVSGYLKEHVYLGSNRIVSIEDTLAPPIVTAPVANAGADLTVVEGTTATLDGTQSTPNAGGTYIWGQTAGPTVTLTGADTLTPSFVAPSGLYSAVLRFNLRVENGSNSYSIDSVIVTVGILDTDNDGLSDNFEIASFGGLSQTGAGDFDNDGLTNLQEWQQGSNPTVVNQPDLTVGFFARPGDTQNTIYWANDARVQNYDLYWSTQPGVTPTTGTLISNVSSPYLHTGLTNGQTYYYILVATSGCCQAIAPEQKVTTGQSGWSNASLINNVDDFSMNQSGQAILVWSESTSSSVKLFSRRFDPASGWLAAEKFAEWNYGYVGFDSIIKAADIDEDGDVVILYNKNGPTRNDPVEIFIIENDVNIGWSVPNLIKTANTAYDSYNMKMSFVDNDFAVILWTDKIGLNYQLNMTDYRKGRGVTANSVIESGLNRWWVFSSPYAFTSDGNGNALLAWGVAKDGVGINIENKFKAKIYNRAMGWGKNEDVVDLNNSINYTDQRCSDIGVKDYNLSASQQGYTMVFTLAQCYGSPGLYAATYTNNKWEKELISSGVPFDRTGTFVHPHYGGNHEILLSKTGTVYFNEIEFNDGGSIEFVSFKSKQDTSWSIPSYTLGYSPLWSGPGRAGMENQSMQEDINGNLFLATNHYVFTFSETNGMRMPIIPDISNANSAFVKNLSMDGTGNGMLLRTFIDGSGLNSVTRGIYANYYTYLPGSPVADAGSTRKITAGQMVLLDGSGSSDANGNITSYGWQQIGGTPITITNANSAVASVTPIDESAFKLTIVDNQGLISTDTVIIQVFSPAEVENNVANAGSNQIVSEGDQVTLDGSASTPVSAYFWRQVSGPTVHLVNPYAVTTTFHAPQVTIDTPILFELLISNGSDIAPGSLSKSLVTVTVQDYTQANQAPMVNAGPDQSIIDNINTSQFVTLAGNVSDSDGTVTQYRWKQIFGPLVTLNNPNSMAPSFKAWGTLNGGPITYVFELSATDNNAVTTTDTVSIMYEARKFVVNATVTNSYNLNGYNFTEYTLSSSMPDATIQFGFDTIQNPNGSPGTQYPFSVNLPYAATYAANSFSYPQRYSVPILVQTGENLGNFLKINIRAVAPDGTITTVGN